MIPVAMAVALGGAVGSVLRFLTASWVVAHWPRHFYLGTFTVNILGCLLIGLLLVTAPGCNYMLLLGYLIGGPPQEEPQFEKETKKSMTDKDVRVAVVCYAPDDLKYKFENIDHILAKAVAVQLANSDLKRVSPFSTTVPSASRSG